MTARTPVVHNSSTNVHEPLAAADTLTFTPAQIADLQAQLGLPDDNQTASQVVVSPAINGGADVQTVLQGLASAIATSPSELFIQSMSFNAGTGVLTITRNDGQVFTVTITDVEFANATAPAGVVDAAIPTTRIGANTAYLGAPDGWMSINGKRVPYWN